MNNRALTDDEIKAVIIERRKAERAAKEHERYLAIKAWLCVGSLIACAAMVWAGAWIAYAFA